MITKSYPFDNAGNYVFDTNKIEVVGGFGQTKNIIDPNELAFNDFSSKNLFRNVGGSNIGTLIGVGVVAGGVLDIPNGLGGWTFNPTGMLAANPSLTTRRFKFKPHYSGTPATDQYILIEQKSGASTNNQIQFRHRSGTGNIEIIFRDSLGGGEGTFLPILGWSPIAETIYELELNVDSVTGNTKLFIDGVQQGGAHPNVYVRDNTTAYIQIGNAGVVGNFSIDDFQMLDGVQHTANFESEIPRTVPLTKYDTNNPTIDITSVDGMKDLVSFLATEVTPAGSAFKYSLFYDGTYWWLQGGIFVISDGTYAQANTQAELIAQLAIGVIDIAPDAVVGARIFLNSDGTAQPKIDLITFGYNLFVPLAFPIKCVVWGYIFDNCIVESDPTITFKTKKPFGKTPNLVSINEEITSVDLSSSGYWSILLAVTQDVSAVVEIVFKYVDLKGKNQKLTLKKYIPALASQNVIDLPDAV